MLTAPGLGRVLRVARYMHTLVQTGHAVAFLLLARAAAAQVSDSLELKSPSFIVKGATIHSEGGPRVDPIFGDRSVGTALGQPAAGVSIGASSSITLVSGVWPATVGAAFDQDRDLVPNVTDNCTLVPNTLQIDADHDGYGNACDPDLNNDRVVNFVDLARLKAAFFTNDPVADFNGDGLVNFGDLAIMKKFFFQKPGPSGLACAGHIPCPPPGQ